MANKSLFQILSLFRDASGARRTTVRNEAGGQAFALSAKQKLAQFACTGCLSQTFYASAETQLEDVLLMAEAVEPEFLAKVAIYARQRGFMKDMPALLCAILAVRGPEHLPSTFTRVIDNGRMLRNFVQIIRSGAVGRSSLGTMPRRLVRDWLRFRSDAALVAASIGQSPSLADIIRMVHPKPESPERSALFAYICGRPYQAADLPAPARQLEQFKRGESGEAPDVPFQLLTALNLTADHWRTIARNASWQTTRMNLATFSRHGVFEHPLTRHHIAQKLRDPAAIRRARVFPYQLMTAFKHAPVNLPVEIREALQDGMECATKNVPTLPGKVYVAVDVSGSMRSAATGRRRGATSVVTCLDVAALFSAAILRRNPSAEVIPFSDDVIETTLNPRDSIMTNARILTELPSGGTDCSAPLRMLNRTRAQGDLVILVSDNESWIHPGSTWSTSTLNAWNVFKKRNPRARLACIDIQPYTTVQAPPHQDILHVGGFTDQVFNVLASFVRKGDGEDHWVREIERFA